MPALALAAAVLTALAGCSNDPPDLGVVDDRLKACPSTPNCVSSEAKDEEDQRIDPMQPALPLANAMAGIERVMRAWPRTRVVGRADDYLHVTCHSRIFGFIDDLEFYHSPRSGRIEVRSAARTGYSDLGVNRRRLEAIRQELKVAGIIL